MPLIKRIIKSEKTKFTNLKKTIDVALDKEKIIIKWYTGEDSKQNFGDVLNPWLFEKMTGKSPVQAKKIFNISNKPIYSCIGSVLDYNGINNLIVWGSGFKSADSYFHVKPNKVLAVRGPLSRKKLLNMGIECPEIYGDPALLLPKYYKPRIQKKYKLGIIPHYIDKTSKNFVNFSNKMNEDVLIIDIESNIEKVIDEILSCEKIASSSLHGIITADAYNIPSLHVKFSDNIIGGNFKYKDYMASVNREFKKPLKINENTTLDIIYDNFYDYSIEIDLNKLIDVCPFL